MAIEKRFLNGVYPLKKGVCFITGIIELDGDKIIGGRLIDEPASCAFYKLEGEVRNSKSTASLYIEARPHTIGDSPKIIKLTKDREFYRGVLHHGDKEMPIVAEIRLTNYIEHELSQATTSR